MSKDKPPTLLSDAKYKTLSDCFPLIENVAGAIIEFGVYKGGNLYRIASHFKDTSRNILGVDTFEGLPMDGEDTKSMYKGRFDDLTYKEVSTSLKQFPNLHLIVGEFPLSKSRLELNHIAFAHLDMDIGLPTYCALDWLQYRMLKGAKIVLDDWNWRETPGIAKALEYFLVMARYQFHAQYHSDTFQVTLTRI